MVEGGFKAVRSKPVLLPPVPVLSQGREGWVPRAS